MKLKEFKEVLEKYPSHGLIITLVNKNQTNSKFVPSHFHITEVGKVQKTFIDCGGIMRENTTCLLQVWTADDEEHRLVASKLAKIITIADKFLTDELEVEIEYGENVASQYKLQDCGISNNTIFIICSSKQTDCLAPDKCGVKTNCCESGCC